MSFKLNKNGMSLIELLVGIGIMSIIMAGFASMQIYQQRENRATSEKLAALDLTRVITAHIANSNTCSLIFASSNLTSPSAMPVDLSLVSPSNPYTFAVKQIPSIGNGPPVAVSGTAASPLSSSLVLLPETASPPGLQVVVTGPNSATLNVNFDQSLLVRSIKNLSFPLAIQMGAPATTITGCSRSANTLAYGETTLSSTLADATSTFTTTQDGVLFASVELSFSSVTPTGLRLTLSGTSIGCGNGASYPGPSGSATINTSCIQQIPAGTYTLTSRIQGAPSSVVNHQMSFVVVPK